MFIYWQFFNLIIFVYMYVCKNCQYILITMFLVHVIEIVNQWWNSEKNSISKLLCCVEVLVLLLCSLLFSILMFYILCSLCLKICQLKMDLLTTLETKSLLTYLQVFKALTINFYFETEVEVGTLFIHATPQYCGDVKI